MNLTISEFKQQPLFQKIDSLFSSSMLFHKRLQPLLNVIVLLQNQKPFRNKLELFNATGLLERKFDKFYKETDYSNHHHYHEVLYIRAIVEILRENEKDPFNEIDLFNLIRYFLKNK